MHNIAIKPSGGTKFVLSDSRLMEKKEEDKNLNPLFTEDKDDGKRRRRRNVFGFFLSKLR